MFAWSSGEDPGDPELPPAQAQTISATRRKSEAGNIARFNHYPRRSRRSVDRRSPWNGPAYAGAQASAQCGYQPSTCG